MAIFSSTASRRSPGPWPRRCDRRPCSVTMPSSRASRPGEQAGPRRWESAAVSGISKVDFPSVSSKREESTNSRLTSVSTSQTSKSGIEHAQGQVCRHRAVAAGDIGIAAALGGPDSARSSPCLTPASPIWASSAITICSQARATSTEWPVHCLRNVGHRRGAADLGDFGGQFQRVSEVARAAIDLQVSTGHWPVFLASSISLWATPCTRVMARSLTGDEILTSRPMRFAGPCRPFRRRPFPFPWP